ncbi:MAG TPA: hypothetical protein VFJ63_00145 [Candidatus Bathyarchaeia archaeon]|nr:hypothetical protein [Candidatus Bathyarchaeia archaeon]
MVKEKMVGREENARYPGRVSAGSVSDEQWQHWLRQSPAVAAEQVHRLIAAHA